MIEEKLICWLAYTNDFLLESKQHQNIASLTI